MKKKRKLVVEKRNGVIYVRGRRKRLPRTKPNFRILDQVSGATLQNGDPVNPRELFVNYLEKEVIGDGKKKRKKQV